MIEYFVRNLTPRTFQIAKFEDTDEPTEIYKVTENLSTNWFHCDCMGFRRNQSQDHKHILMAMWHQEKGFNYFSGEKLEGSTVF